MRKPVFFAVTAVLAMIAGFNVSAQTIGSLRFGVFGGYTASRATGASTDVMSYTTNRVPLYHAGITAQIPVFSGFSLQPSVSWQMKGVSLDKAAAGVPAGNIVAKMGYLEGSVQVQYGPDLLLFRPYALVEPYLGYGLYTNCSSTLATPASSASAAMPRMEYGTGVGFGFEIWHVQLAFKWFWNFGSLYSAANTTLEDAAWAAEMKQAFEKGGNFRGFSISATWFLF